MAPAPLRPYVEELTDESTGLRVGIMRKAAVDLELEQACIDAVDSAAKLIESIGHNVEEKSFLDLIPEGGDGPDIGDTFLTRWAAGQAATLAQLGMLLGREVTADDVEPLTWQLAQIGHDRDGGRYLQDVALHQGLSRMIAMWFESGYDLLLSPTMAEVPPPIGAIDTHEPDLGGYTRCLPSRRLHGALQRHRPAGDLPAAALERGWPAGRRAARRAVRSRGPADPHRGAAGAGAALGRPHPRSLRGLTAG